MHECSLNALLARGSCDWCGCTIVARAAVHMPCSRRGMLLPEAIRQQLATHKEAVLCMISEELDAATGRVSG